MKAGRLRDVIQLQEFVTVKGRIGGSTKEWLDFGEELPAEIKDLRGGLSEQVSQGGQVPTCTTEIRTRHYPGVQPQMRARDLRTDETYTITFVNDWERRGEMLILSCDKNA